MSQPLLLTFNYGWDTLTEADIDALRKADWSGRAILDATLVVSYFAFVNRIAEGLGVQLEGETNNFR